MAEIAVLQQILSRLSAIEAKLSIPNAGFELIFKISFLLKNNLNI
jgi:hypothetical protein